MKQALYFQSEQEFQNLCAQILSAESSSFQAIEGSGGDGGLDGLDIDQLRAYQVFYPDLKNRNDRHFTEKIEDSLGKLAETIKSEQLDIKEWIFIVPEDLRYKVAIRLSKKAKDIGVIGVSWGATKLTELLNKYPHIRNSFPGIFLPDVKEDLGQLKVKIDTLTQPTTSGFRIISDDEFDGLNQEIENEFKQRCADAASRFGSSSAFEQAMEIFKSQANDKRKKLQNQKLESDRMYALDCEEVEDKFTKKHTEAVNDLAGRGLTFSGMAQKTVDDIRKEKARELERLRIKYGMKNSLTTQ